MPVHNVLDFGAVGDGTADDSGAIQQALDAARDDGGGEVAVPGGTYIIRKALVIYSHTHLRLAEDATIVRDAPINVMLVNSSDGSGGYEAARDIRVSGGTWDGRMDANDVRFTVIAAGHATGVRVEGVRILNVRDWHAVELNAVKDGRVTDCYFSGFTLTRRWSEAIQLDLMINSSAFPWFGPYDHTPCTDIEIRGCTFTGGWDRGIGTHSETEGVYHTHIRITGNHFEELVAEGIEGLRYRYLHIGGNTFHRVQAGIQLTRCSFAAITGNTFYQPAADGITLREDSENSTIGNNVIQGAGGSGVVLQNGANRNIVTGNVITGCKGGGIRRVQSKGNITIPNQQHNNGA
ncbi:right-handed parallel beta-helix repeat-containing protein [Desmospora profundinema]|uniref:Parallel beta-helix repeat protein n=1 Tax=Desmospora profundinema TaxID=1571184 RepID=A0ABU1IPR2_9BACL|nr:right-handed parallel beta-helix repeat-containing protein [Desmospora profundinema]MDR6226789.1 parallel beta-helix repeat protein [Desmospora profundinema]